MKYHKNLSLIVVLLIMFSGTALTAELEQQVYDNMKEQISNQRSQLRNNRAVFANFRAQTENYVVSERILQFIDNVTDEWENYEKETFSYDDMGRLSVIHRHHWDEIEEEWVEMPLTTYFTWSNSGLLLEILYRFQEGPIVFDYLVLSQSFNDNDQIIDIEVEVFDETIQELVLEMKFEFSYDNDGMAESVLFTDYEYMVYENIAFTYDSYGRLEETLIEFSEDGEEWLLDAKEVSAYHPEDQSSYQDVQKYLNLWALFNTLNEITWVDEPRVESVNHYDWNDDWQPVDRVLFSYLPDLSIESVTYEEYVGVNDWSPTDLVSYSYDAQGFAEMIEYLYYHNDQWNDHGRLLLDMMEISDVEEDLMKPSDIVVENYPNPFNPETTIRFTLDRKQKVKVSVFNILGQRMNTLIQDKLPTGTHSVLWDGRDEKGNMLASGVYFYRLKSKDSVVTGKMLFLK